jgi:hypothetical protein
LRDVAGWVLANTPLAMPGKSRIVLFDGREASDDDVGVRQFLAALNQFLRRRPDVLFCWPTTDNAWHRKLRSIAENIGGANFCPSETDHTVVGPSRSQWPTMLERPLLQYQKTLDDVGMSPQLVVDFGHRSQTAGDFLTQASMAVSDRIANRQKDRNLPQLLFVITSSGDVTGEANRIRRAGKQVLAAEPLLGYSPRSEAGKWWTERNKDLITTSATSFRCSMPTSSRCQQVQSCTLAFCVERTI